MNALEIVFGIVLMLFAIAIIIVVLLQEGSQKSPQAAMSCKRAPRTCGAFFL